MSIHDVIVGYRVVVAGRGGVFRRLLEVLGIRGPGEGGRGKESIDIEAASKAQVQRSAEEWLRRELGGYVGEDYVNRGEVRDILGKARGWLARKLAMEITEKVRKGKIDIDSKDIVLDDEVIDGQFLDFLMYMRNEGEFVRESIGRSLGIKSGDKVEGEDKRRRKKWEPGVGETWFTPIVSEQLYNNYKKYMETHSDKYEGVSGGKELSPEMIGVYRGKVDPHILKHLDKLGKFTIRVHDARESGLKGDVVWSYTFSIPELAKLNPEIYSDILFDKKMPNSVDRMRVYSERDKETYPVTVVRGGGEKGLGIRMDQSFKDWQERGLSRLREVGPRDEEVFKKIVTDMIGLYVDREMGPLGLEELVEHLGGRVGLRTEGGVSQFSSVGDLEDLVGFGGKSVTEESLEDKHYRYEEYHKRDVAIEEMVSKVKALWSPRVMEYIEGMDKDETDGIRKAVVSDSKFKSMEDLIELKRLGNLKVSIHNMFKTKEVIGLALAMIFDERVVEGETSWKGVLADYLKVHGTRVRGFGDFIRLLMYQEDLKSRKENVAAGLRAVDIDELNQKIPDAKVMEYYRGKVSASTMRVATQEMRDEIRDSILSQKEKPAFKNFFGRLKMWEELVGDTINTKVERVLSGEDPIPTGVKVPTAMAKTVSVFKDEEGKGKSKKIDPSKFDADIYKANKDNQSELQLFTWGLFDYFMKKQVQKVNIKTEYDKAATDNLAIIRMVLNRMVEA